MKRAVLVLSAGVLAFALIVALRPDSLSAGPVSAGKGATGNGQLIDVGVPYSFGYLLKNYGAKPAVVETVRVLGVTGPIEVLDVWARPHPSGPKPVFFMLAFGFPPPEYPSKPLAQENVVPVPSAHPPDEDPREGLQLVVGVKSTGPGVGRIRGIEFTYRVGGRRYRNSYDGSGYLCAPAAAFKYGDPDKDCPGKSAEDDFDKKFVEIRVPADKQPGA